MEDITKTGPVGLQGLKGISQQQQDDLSEYSKAIRSMSGRRIAQAFTPNAEVPVGAQLAAAGYGESIYDDAIQNVSQLEDIQDIRAQEQPWYAQLGAGIGKGVALAATTFLDGTVGLITGIAEGGIDAYKGIKAETNGQDWDWGGTVSKLWHNEVSDGLAQLNESLEEWLPNYRTYEEQENPWYKNLGTMNFWADNVIKNLGFTVGAYYSGGAWNKALKAIGALKGAMGAKVIGSFTSALNEGRIEANQNSRDFLELQYQQIEDAIKERTAEMGLPEDSDFFKEDEIRLKEDAKERANAMGLATLIGNTVLLSIDNFDTFGKLYARGYKNARTIAKGRVTREAMSEGLEKAGREIAQEEAGKRITKEAGKYIYDPVTKKRALARGLRHGLVEGNEEMAQAFIAETAGNMQSPDSPDAYYEALLDPSADIKTRDFLEAVTEGFVNTYGNGDRWEEFAVGAFTGLLGIPTFGKVQNSDVNTWLGRGKTVGISGGLFGEFGVANQENREGQEAVDFMNDYAQKVQEQKGHFVQSQSFTDAMDGWAAADDAFEYKNAEDNSDFAAISRFAKVGRINDLKDMVNQDFENIPDEELVKIAEFTSSEDGLGGWRNTDGSLMSDSEEGREQMKKELIAKRDKILSEIDKYEKSVATVRAIGNNSLTEDQVNELAWLNWKVGMFTDRYNSIKNENQEFLAEMQRGLQAFQNGRGTNIIDEESEEGQKLIKAMNNALEFVNTLEKTKSPLQLSAYLEANPHMTEFLEEFAYPIIEDMIGVDAATFEKSMNDLKDVVKIAKATKTFNERYKEFRDNPVELINNRAKINKKKEKVKKATEAINTKDKINNADVSDIVKEMKGGEVNADELDGLFSDEDSEFMQNIGANPEEMSGKQKVDEAKKIIQTKDQADKAINALAGDPTMDAQALADAHTLLDASMDVANSEQEMLDTARQAFNDPTILYDDSLAGLTQDELASALNDRVQAAKSVIERVKGSLQDAQAELNKLPKKPVLEDIGLNLPAPKDTGHDAVNKTITENERQKLAQEKEAQKKAAEERKQKLDSFFSKHKEDLSDEDKAKFDKALADVLQGIDLLTQVDATDREIRSGMQDTLSYDILKQLAPTIDADLDVYITSKRKPTETPKVEPKSGEQNLPTPPMSTNDILNYTTRQENQDPNKGELDGSYKYWKPTITYLPIHNPTGNLVPFYKLARGMKYPNGASMFSEQQLNRIEKVGKYLEEHGAFALVDRGEVKTGSNVHFSIDKSLSDSVGELVILMTDDQGRVIGDVMSPNDPTFGRQAGLATLVRNIQSEYEEAGSPDIFTSAKYITKVDKNMVGKVPYQANHDTMNSLNAVHTNGNERIPFTLGIAVTSGSNARILATAGRTKKQGASKIEQTINPPLEAKAGQPFLLFPTSSEKNHFIPVPFLMDTYREGTKNTALGRAIRSVLDKIPQSSDREVMSIINGLEELLSVKEVHINYSDDNVKVTIKPHGEEHQRTIYNGSKSDPTAVDQIEYGLQVQSLPFQISRKYINEDYFGQDYNRMIGEIAMINLPVGQTHTVSDWFTVKPLDANGTITKAKSPRSTGQNPNAANVPTVTIPYKGMELSVDTKTWEVSDGTRTYTGERADLVKAQAFGIFTNKDMTKPYNTEWGYYDPTTKNWYIQPAEVVTDVLGGELVQPKGGPLEQLVEENFRGYFEGGGAIIEDEFPNIPQALITKFESSLWGAGPILTEEEAREFLEKSIPELLPKTKGESQSPEAIAEKAKQAGLLNNKIRQALWDVLTPSQQATIANKKGPKAKQWMDALENAFNPATNTFDEVKLKGTVDELLGRKGMYRREGDTPETWNEEKEMAWMKQVLPNLSDEEHLKIIRGVSRLATEDGGFAYGKFQNGVITLAGNTARGTLYHEAFHAVAHTLLSADELDTLLEEAKKKWGNLNDVALEENLAEDFRKYVQLEETPILGTVVKIYRTLKHLVQNLIGNEPYINKLFYDINRGNMAESVPQATEATRYQMAEGFKGTVSEFQEIIDSYVNNPAVVHKLIDRNKLWGRLTDGWLKEGYIVKGYYDKKTGKWTVASAKKSDITNNTPSYYRKVEQYHRDKLMYNNLSQEDKNYLQERGISTDEYSKMTQLEKEVLFNCKY